MKPGDPVRLKIGSPVMMINRIEGSMAKCVRFVGNELKEDEFALDGLTPVTTDVMGAETVAEYIRRVFQIESVSGPATLLQMRVTSATSKKSGKGHRVTFIVDDGRELGFWTEAAHGPFVKDMTK